jgi:lipopolysaccharide export system protein LptC
MPFDRRTWIIGLAALALALAAWWLRMSQVQDHRVRASRPPYTPDYWIDNLNALETDPAGVPRRRLEAKRVEHYPDDQSTALLRPQLWLLEPGRPPWHIRSEHGWVSPDGAVLLLQGEVRIDRDGADGVTPVHLRTRDLRVQPKDEYAETTEPVHARSGRHRVDSVGLQAWLRPPVHIKLLADVRAHYEAGP